ncbi:MAG: hypothetical protein J2P48_21490, partial [Alphaproteobacteria bacterium]|nr:hypothetical protein [Alphaproteobacteria bacterium]
ICCMNRSVLTLSGAILPRAPMHGILDPFSCWLKITLGCDFRHSLEVKANRIMRCGWMTTKWSALRRYLRTTRRNGDCTRAVTLFLTGGSASRSRSNPAGRGIASSA